jgi:hypothetical protein
MAARTQATNMPERIGNERIDPIDKLQGRHDYEDWLFFVNSQLRQLSLQDLIDYDIPRPQLDDPKYATWNKASLIVRNWLVLQVERDIITELRTSSDPHEYADEAMKAIRTIVTGYGHNMALSTWKKAVYMKRENYGSIDQFVQALKHAVQDSNRVKMPITPYQATSIS